MKLLRKNKKQTLNLTQEFEQAKSGFLCCIRLLFCLVLIRVSGNAKAESRFNEAFDIRTGPVKTITNN